MQIAHVIPKTISSYNFSKSTDGAHFHLAEPCIVSADEPSCLTVTNKTKRKKKRFAAAKTFFFSVP